MTVTIHVNGRSNSLVHKGSSGIAKSTLPDVCKTPSPGGPVPIPYPVIVSVSSDLRKGTKTVKVDGGNSAAIKDSELARCTGDEPGTAGGVKSSTNMKEATWILYSFDVKFEGKNTCRLSDKLMMNHANTACLAGFLQKLVDAGMTLEEACEKLMERIEDLVGEGRTGKKNGIKGLEERMREQITERGAPHHPPDRPPTTEFPGGSNSWQRHDREVENQQKNLNKRIDEYNDKCNPPGPPVPVRLEKWVDQKRPEPRDWRGPSWEIDWGKVGWGVAAVGLTVATIALFISPFDGPIGDLAAGSAAAGAWGMVLGSGA